MNYLNLFKIALKAIYNNKTRSLLTMLGIIIGIASVIAMLGFGQGTQEQITNEISSMGRSCTVCPLYMPPGEIIEILSS